MKIPDFLKKTAVAAFVPSPDSTRDARREAAEAYVAWHKRWSELQTAYRATHPPGTRVPGPRQLGMSWPPPVNPNASLTVRYRNDPGADS